MTNPTPISKLAPTGLSGLDHMLQGGLPPGRAYLVLGPPGAGKTTLGLQFLREGLKSGERVMLVSLMESPDELSDAAASHGWDLDGIEIMYLSQEARRAATELQTVFLPSEVEFGQVADAVVKAIEAYRPQRLLVDSVSQLSMLTDSWYQLRGPVIRIRDLVHRLECTALLTSSNVEEQGTRLETLVHGSIHMEMEAPSFGQLRRQLIIKKMRGHKFKTGYQHYCIRTGGIEIYIWPTPRHDSTLGDWNVLSSGIRGLDDLLGGGLEEGTACLITGTSGSGKSTLGSLYAQSAAERGQKSILFCFDERRDTFLRRSRSLNLKISDFIESGLIDLRQVNAGEFSPGEFAYLVGRSVEENRAKVVVIDSISGYFKAMPEDNLLMTQLHELLSHLSSLGVLTIIVFSNSSQIQETEVDPSYIADTVVLMRHFEAGGRLRRCIAVLKKRHGRHEHTIREFKITEGGCQVGQPLTAFSGILSGTPTYLGGSTSLLQYPDET